MKIPRTIPWALLLSLPILGAAFLPKYGQVLGGHSAFARGLWSYGLMVLLAALAMAWQSDGNWQADLGLRKPAGSWGRLVIAALLLGIAMTLALKASPGKGMEGALKGMNPPQMMLLLLLGSAAEEVFVRGWLQGFLQPMRERALRLGSVRVSAPVLTGALAFGAMHLPAVLRIDGWTVAFILVFTTTLGLLAGLARERTDSLLPAIGVHLAGNAGGILGTLLFLTLRRLA